MDIYKQDTESRKFCIKYEKMNDFKNKDENKIFDCSKEQKVYGFTNCFYVLSRKSISKQESISTIKPAVLA